MTYRILALIAGILIGIALHAAIAPRGAAPETAGAAIESAGAPVRDSRCPKQAIKMPCLFDSVPPAGRKQ